MKIGVASSGPDLEAQVERRLGACAYLLVVDTETLAFEATPAASDASRRGAGVRNAVLALQKEVDAVLAGYISPNVAETLEENEIEVITGITGTVYEAIQSYVRRNQALDDTKKRPESSEWHRRVSGGLRRTSRQFASILPVLVGVVLLIGLFKSLVSREVLAWVFRGNPLLDTLGGAVFGSILAGNPVNSYVIGRALLDGEVSLFAVTAVIVTWASVGVVQLPAEIAALGRRFAVVRIITVFFISILIAVLTGAIVLWLT